MGNKDIFKNIYYLLFIPVTYVVNMSYCMEVIAYGC